MANTPAWFNEVYYLNSKLAQLRANGETGYNNIVDVLVAIQAAGLTPYEHFEAYSLVERTSPNQYFNAVEYLNAKARQLNDADGVSTWTADGVAIAIMNAGLNLYEHFHQYGWAEGVNPSNDFDVSLYLEAKLAELQAEEPDAGWTEEKLVETLQAAGLDPVEHYIEFGADEGIAVSPAVDPVPSSDPDISGGTFTLTANTDFADGSTAFINNTIPSNFRFTSSNETVRALDGTWNATDILLDVSTTDNDVLEATIATAGNLTLTPQIQNIETIKINLSNAAAAGTLNFANASGVKTVTVSGTATSAGLTNLATAGVSTVDASGVTAGALTIAATTATTTDMTVTGGAGADTITTSAGDDVINGGAGNDTINAGAGDNVVDGGAGNDIINATTGNNVIKGGAGDDTVTVGSGNNDIDMGTGANETVNAGNGNNVIVAAGTAANVFTVGNGNNTITMTGAGTTTVTAGRGDNTITIGDGGTAGGGIVITGNGNNSVTSGAGADTVAITGDGNNVISTGGGADIITITAAVQAGTNVITAGNGADTITLAATSGADTVVQGTGSGVAATANALTVGGIAANDTITFGNGLDQVTNFQAGAGGDVLDLVAELAPVSAVGLAPTALAVDTNYFLSVTVGAGNVLTVVADGTAGSSTLIVQGYAGAGADLTTNTSAILLVGVDSDDLVAANFA